MRILRFGIVAALAVSVAACGSTVEEPTKKVQAPAEEAANNSSDNNDNTNNNDNQTNNTPDDQYARQICERVNTCMGQMTCTQPAQIDVNNCISQLMSQNVDAQAASYYDNLPCDEINKSQCSASPQLQEMCECPTSPQGTCEEGLFCSVALSANGQTLYACGSELGSIPTDAPSCSQASPTCDEGLECIMTSQDGSTGACLAMCEQ